MKDKFTKNTTLAEILESPEAEKILAKYNLPCLSCPLAAMEIQSLKIGQACKIYGLNLKALLKELNQLGK